MKILVVFGTRPEAIKLAPVIKAMEKTSEIKRVVCVTSQHKEMLDQVLGLFEIVPDYDLGIMKENQTLFDITVEGLSKLGDILQKEIPDIILVQGDTTTTFLASLAAYYLKIKIGHIEAGLRTRDKFNPFPEEMNRRLTDCLADLYFAPTEKAKTNLMSEGVGGDKIFVTGNTIIDALLMSIEKQKDPKLQKVFGQRFHNHYRISFDSKKLILVTGHRRESFGKELENICNGLRRIAESNQDVQIIYPVHLNPNVQEPVRRILTHVKNVHLIEPLDYLSFVWLMNRAYLILTDSGGIQEEAPSLGKPVLVMRERTERMEGIEAGTAKLVGTDCERIFSETMKLIKDQKLYDAMAKTVNPYGDGKASERILEVLIGYLYKGCR